MRTEQSKTIPELEEAHNLLKEGQRGEAYSLVCELLQRQPDNTLAKALRDRIDNEEYSESVERQRERQDIFEEEDVTPLLPIGLLVVAIVTALVATYLAIRPIRMGLQMGFTTEIDMGGAYFGKTAKYPVHILLMTPVLFYILSAICYFGYRRYRT